METRSVLRGFAVVVLDRGFVYVGDVSVDDEWCVITNARNVRRYGTERGLGQLALDGPQPNTVLDDCGTIRAPVHALQHVIETEVSKWKRS